MNNINSERTYLLGNEFSRVLKNALILQEYMNEKSIYRFDQRDKSISFLTEALIPTGKKHRPRIMLLFSNPHPHSVAQGMFLSPNRKGRENLFWSTMKEAGLLSFRQDSRDTRQAAEACLNAEYEGPFEYLFYCYYAFPTHQPIDIKSIFGKYFFNQTIEPEAAEDFRQLLSNNIVQAIITFNKLIFNKVSDKQVNHCLSDLKRGSIIRSEVTVADRPIPIFLTFPTGWRYHKDYVKLRRDSLEHIKTAIMEISDVSQT